MIRGYQQILEIIQIQEKASRIDQDNFHMDCTKKNTKVKSNIYNYLFSHLFNRCNNEIMVNDDIH